MRLPLRDLCSPLLAISSLDLLSVPSRGWRRYVTGKNLVQANSQTMTVTALAPQRLSDSSHTNCQRSVLPSPYVMHPERTKEQQSQS